MGTVEKAKSILDSALSHSNGAPLAYSSSYQQALRRQILEFIEVRKMLGISIKYPVLQD